MTRSSAQGVDRDGLIFGRVLRTEIIANGQAGELIVKMDDQPFAGKHLESWRRIEIAAGPLPVRRRSADYIMSE